MSKNVEQGAAYAALYSQAYAAGMAALAVKVPVPFVITPNMVQLNGVPVSNQTYVNADGPCGFAWVNVSPGTSGFAKWLKQTGRAGGACSSGLRGVSIWVSEGNQSLEKKEAYAEAFAEVLKAAQAGGQLPGVKYVGVDSRMD